jgi:surfeit locus 1 family protein
LTQARLLVVVAGAAMAFIGFVALGAWQLERRTWKLALIARVEQRVHAAPVAAPGSADWDQVSTARDEYRRVRLTGTFVHDAEALVQASTELGAGWWVLTPLRQADGTIVLVNRGFVPPQQRDRSLRAKGNPLGEVEIVGLLRLSEPGGGFLRRNDPVAERWFSRDVMAISAVRRLNKVAPYFVDAERAPTTDPQAPVAGLTVLDFRDNHLAYAITWFALAAMVAAAAVALVQFERRRVTPG